MYYTYNASMLVGGQGRSVSKRVGGAYLNGAEPERRRARNGARPDRRETRPARDPDGASPTGASPDGAGPEGARSHNPNSAGWVVRRSGAAPLRPSGVALLGPCVVRVSRRPGSAPFGLRPSGAALLGHYDVYRVPVFPAGAWRVNPPTCGITGGASCASALRTAASGAPYSTMRSGVSAVKKRVR